MNLGPILVFSFSLDKSVQQAFPGPLYCQAQPQLQPNLAEVSSILDFSTPPTQPPVKVVNMAKSKPNPEPHPPNLNPNLNTNLNLNPNPNLNLNLNPNLNLN